MHTGATGREKPEALSLLSAHRPRNVGWRQAAGLLFGDWGTSRLYVLGLAFLFAGRSSFWLICLMSGLILAVGWAYTQICRIYPDGGGVYTAARSRSRMLAVIGALLLFADYTVTASLSTLDAFHYFGLPLQHHAQVEQAVAATTNPDIPVVDAGDAIVIEHATAESSRAKLLAWDSPGLWAILCIAAIGCFNLMGPKHTGGFALLAAMGMVAITLLVAASALPQVPWHEIPYRIPSLIGTFRDNSAAGLWVAFVSIVLALSGVEAIANLTGVMKKPVSVTSRKAIWVVACEVAIFNVILALAMLAIFPLDREAHVNDMMALLSSHYIGAWGEWAVRIVGGLLLISAGNTALTDMISIQYLMARDGELPQFMQKLNRFGVPWAPALVAASVPILVLLVSHDLESLAALYAIGVIGAVAINVTLCAFHPRLRRLRRKVPMILLGFFLVAIWVTLALTKLHALVFVCIVMIVGLSARRISRSLTRRRGGKPSLIRQAIMEQLRTEDFSRRKILIGTYGSEKLAPAALAEAKRLDAVLVVCFIRQVTLSYKYDEEGFTIDTDPAAIRTFSRYLELAHEAGVHVIPVYDTGPDAAELLAENAAAQGCDRVLIGTSRQGTLYHLIRGHFHRRLDSLLPPEVKVEVIGEDVIPAVEGVVL
jgi:amino acid transporter/nucleotide-binding universal stress UspA family protein